MVTVAIYYSFNRFFSGKNLSLFVMILFGPGICFSGFNSAYGQNRRPVITTLETREIIHHDTTIILHNTSIDISYPEGKINGCILVLPGWNFSREDVCRNSEFCKLAKQNGYCLIRPEMGKSIYLLNTFPETRQDWMHYPTLRFITDTLIPYCQNNFSILKSGDKNFLFGISTGGRGVAQIAMNTGSLFVAGAALSGDFNQLLQKDDKLMMGYLGTFDNYPSRWSGKDNPSENAAQLQIPLFLGHGKADKIVPVVQTTTFFDRITFVNPGLKHILHIDETGGHNYDYWNSELQRIFAFFYSHL